MLKITFIATISAGKFRVHFRVISKKNAGSGSGSFQGRLWRWTPLLIKVTGTHFQYDEFNYDASIYGNISAGKMYK